MCDYEFVMVWWKQGALDNEHKKQQQSHQRATTNKTTSCKGGKSIEQHSPRRACS